MDTVNSLFICSSSSKHSKLTAHACFTIVLFVNLFQNTQFYPYYPFKFFYFFVTVITQIIFLLKSLN